MFLKAVRREVNHLESSVVVSDKSCLIGFLWSLGNQYSVGTFSWFYLVLTTKCGAV